MYDEYDDGLAEFYARERLRERAVKSYLNPDGSEKTDERRYCAICDKLLVCGSISYMAGEHVDSCD